MGIRYQATFTVTADTQAEFDAHKESVLSHPNVIVMSMEENGLTFTFSYDADVDVA